jgi:hypothetical protein
MSQERILSPAPRRPYEIFGFTEEEALYWRVCQERFDEIINDDPTVIHEIKDSSNSFGEFLFVTTSRPGEHGAQNRVSMTFYGLGFHEYRERWFTHEWFWYQANSYPSLIRQTIPKEEALELIQQRREYIQPDVRLDMQTDRGVLFETLADLTDDDGALAEFQDFEQITTSLDNRDEPKSEIIPPTGENLLDNESREKLPPLYSGEEQGLDALAQVKFFTPDSSWSWFASEYDGEDILFGLVVGLEIEFGYFSLSELKSVKGPLGLPIERDLHFDPKSLRELRDQHRRDRGGR